MNKLGAALEEALKVIRREFGEMSVLRLGDAADKSVEVIPTGCLALDLALGVGGLPRGRIPTLPTSSPVRSGRSRRREAARGSRKRCDF